MNPLWTENDAVMISSAFRYCVGRRTYMPGVCADWLIRNWAVLPEHARNIIKRDLEGEFRRDDEAREEGRDYKPLGDDCDRRTWEQVRALWAEQKEQTT